MLNDNIPDKMRSIVEKARKGKKIDCYTQVDYLYDIILKEIKFKSKLGYRILKRFEYTDENNKIPEIWRMLKTQLINEQFVVYIHEKIDNPNFFVITICW